MECPRCETVGRVPKLGTHPAIGPNGTESLICDDCIEEVDVYTYGKKDYENKED